jgi:hypothetical protein
MSTSSNASSASTFTSRALARGLLCCAVPAGLALTMSACMVVPIDHYRVQPTTQGNVPVVVSPMAAPGPQVLNVRLYPVNPEANRVGPLAAVVMDNLQGHGSFSVNYGGQMLQGEATRVGNDYPGFGRILSGVTGDAGGRISGRRGIANAAGAGGANAVSVQCEYVLTAPGQGVGACRMSDGAAYQMHFSA